MRLELKIGEILKVEKKLKVETRLQFDIDIEINPESSTPYLPLNERIIKFLNQTETEVDFDICKADPIGVFKDE